jgi:Reverse transcriptase (RNA-dependent DNA polymerase)
VSVLFVKKKDKTLYLYIDYRTLNKLSVKNVYLLFLISKMLDKLKRAKFFTKINLDRVYHQIRINSHNILKTVFNCQLGHYKFMVMTFGLINAPTTFQHLINHVFEPYNNIFLVVYLDDILIFSKTKQEHLQYVR